MGLLKAFCTWWLILTAVVVSAQKTFNQRTGLKSECLGNVMRVTIDKSLAFGSQLEVDALNGSQIVPLTPELAAKCGYSMESDPWGNTKLYMSLLNCFALNQDDLLFDIGLRLKMLGNRVSEEDVHEVRKTCEYKQWASREVLCERNFMEVSVNRFPPDMPRTNQQIQGVGGNAIKSGVYPEAPTSLQYIWRMVFYTPKEKPMLLADVQQAGYGVLTTPTRLVLRSPYNMPETYSQNMDGVQMEVFKVTTYYKREWAVTMIETAAACPTGGLHFSDEVITWFMPIYIAPLRMSQEHDLLELYMGIDGKRLSQEQMNAMGYGLSLTETQIIISLPIGGPDGYYKSHALNYEYHTTYSIEPMLEMAWREGKIDTRYKVHYPITTPPKPQPPQVTDNTEVQLGFFDVMLGPFLPDVELLNITFSTGVVTVAEANARGLNVQQNRFPNGSKAFSIHIPFSDAAVLKANINPETATYTLLLVFGLVILPEYTPFPQPALLKATLQDIVLPTMRGTCDEEHFNVTVAYGTQGKNFNVMLGTQSLSADLYEEYRVQENSTHLSMVVPFLANNVVFEMAHKSLVRARLDVHLWDPVNDWHIKEFSLACNFPLTMTGIVFNKGCFSSDMPVCVGFCFLGEPFLLKDWESWFFYSNAEVMLTSYEALCGFYMLTFEKCFSNGTMTALAVKVESASHVVPSQLVLKDPSCKPTFSNSRFAYFSFDASSCGTTRVFYEDVMMYQNEISVFGRRSDSKKKGSAHDDDEPDYRMTVACYYTLNDTQTVTFFTKPRRNEPFAESGVGELKVRMRLAKDSSYSVFYMAEDHPVLQYLKEPLYFEVELVQFTDPRIELVLDNCWATVDDVTQMSWDLIVNGCENPDDRYQTMFHPVVLDDRVQYPPHIKRFEVKMFTFVKDDTILRDQMFFHCEAVICDLNQTDAICKRQCPTPPFMARNSKVRRSMAYTQLCRMHVSSGKVVMSNKFQ